MRDFESLGQYHDFWATIILCAPDKFSSLDGSPVDQQAELRASFETLRKWFPLAEKKFKDARLVGVLRELLVMSEEAYVAGEKKRGAHILQECEGLIWPSRAGDLKYVVEAEERAFGALGLFQNVFVSPYPYEGSLADLGEKQRELLEIASAECERLFGLEQDFKWLLWILNKNGVASRENPKSWRKAEEMIRAGFASGSIAAYCKAELGFGGFGGMLIYTLEEPLKPRVNAVAIMRNWRHDPLRFHLENPYLSDDAWLRGDHASRPRGVA
jgi:hypothetical protein